MEEKEIGQVADFFTHVNVIAVKLTEDLSVGDRIHIKGHTTDLYQKVDSMQMEHAPVQAVKKGESFGLHVEAHVREHDLVFKVTED